MKAVLISIKPKWCELIASGKKTIEVRKTRPKLETPFKCYIYCTKNKETNDLLELHIDGKIKKMNGKVIGEFVCDMIDYVRNYGDKERAENLAKIYKADIEEYEDAQEFPKMPMWKYDEGEYRVQCHIIEPDANGKEHIYTRNPFGGITYYGAEVYAEDEAHARKKAQDMIAQYKAEKEGIT